MSLKNRSFLKLLDYTPAEIEQLLDLAADLKAKKKAGIAHDQLHGKNIALIFEKTSTRTRCSFEVAAHDLGMQVTYLDPSGSQIGKKESIADTARQLGLRRTDHVELVCGGDYLTTVWKKDYRGSFGWDSLETLHAEILRRGFRAVGDTFSSILASREQPDGSIINYHLTRTKIYT